MRTQRRTLQANGKWGGQEVQYFFPLSSFFFCPLGKKKMEESHLCRENNSELEQNAVNLHVMKEDSSGGYQKHPLHPLEWLLQH